MQQDSDWNILAFKKDTMEDWLKLRKIKPEVEMGTKSSYQMPTYVLGNHKSK